MRVGSKGLTITNPLVLYRALVATKRIEPDTAQHRLAIHLQKLYHRLKDYEPEIEYGHQLKLLSSALRDHASKSQAEADDCQSKGFLASFREQRAKAESLALTRQLTNHEAAMDIQSPQGLLLHGEVGTGKSMLIDLLADSLPNRKKRRWHFSTFMLETFERLEEVRVASTSALSFHDDFEDEHCLLKIARKMISTSPIIFLDEFQLPDRTASKILSKLFTSFFQLGGVLIATSNRMPEELAKASGVEFASPPPSPSNFSALKRSIFGAARTQIPRPTSFHQQSDFVAFLDLLRARCEVWNMEGTKDWRRSDTKHLNPDGTSSEADIHDENDKYASQGHSQREIVHDTSMLSSSAEKATAGTAAEPALPKNYFVKTAGDRCQAWDQTKVNPEKKGEPYRGLPISDIPWQRTSFHVYGRIVYVPRAYGGINFWKFSELCASNLGPADYISLASMFHTLILIDIPVLTLLQKQEARRLITLLDALYEAKCKLMMQAEAGPDEIFFPETPSPNASLLVGSNEDGTYAETFSEIYQDQTSPFRPNISSYTPSASTPDYGSLAATFPPLARSSSPPSTRSILADEDSDFGPVHGAGRSFGHKNSALRPQSESPASDQMKPVLDFQNTSVFTGDDERFAYKRARSRIWEMCGEKWWARNEEGWWRPMNKQLRTWERPPAPGKPPPMKSSLSDSRDDTFRHGASPFRTSLELPPKFSWVHAWGMMKWGRKAGAWGKGVDGLDEKGREDQGNGRGE